MKICYFVMPHTKLDDVDVIEHEHAIVDEDIRILRKQINLNMMQYKQR